MIDTRLLHVFSVVAEELHFGRAAERLFMTQPPLSQSIRKLEEVLGVQLLLRTTRSVQLTPAGKELQRRVEHLRHEMDLAVEAVRQVHRGEQGSLTVGLTPSSAYSNLSQVLYRFRQRFPGLRLDLTEMNSNEMPDAVLSRRIDLALVRPPFADRDLNPEPIYSEPLVCALRKDHALVRAGRRSLSVREALSLELVGYDRRNSRYFSQLLQMLIARAGITPNIVQESMIPTILTLVEAGIGAAIVPLSLSRLRTDTLAYFPLRDAGAIRAELVAARHSSNGNPAVERFLEVVRAMPMGEVASHGRRDTGAGRAATRSRP